MKRRFNCQNFIALSCACFLAVLGFTAPVSAQDFLTEGEIRSRLFDQPLSTNVPSRWMFRSDGTEFSYGVGDEEWTACGTWSLEENVLCWSGLASLPDGSVTGYGPRCSRLVETDIGFAFTRSAQSPLFQSWGVQKVSSIEPVQGCSQQNDDPLLSLLQLSPADDRKLFQLD